PLMLELFIARRYLKSKSGKFFSAGAFITIVGIFIGVGAIIIVLSVMNGFHQELRNRILGLTPHIIITKYSYEQIDNYDSLVQIIKKHPKVASVAPFIYTKTVIKKEQTSDGVVVRGILENSGTEITDLKKIIVQGSFDISNDNIILGIDLARSIGARVGDEISLVLPFSGEATPLGLLPKIKEYQVVGIFDAGMYDYNATCAYLGLNNLQKLLGFDDEVTGIEIKLKDINQTIKITNELKKIFPFPYRVQNWIGMNRNIFTALRMEKIVTFIVLVLIILVAAFGIVGLLVMMVIRKTKEIGILSAMGMKSKSIVKVFVLTGFLIGVIGATVGAVFGVVASVLLNKYRIVTLPGDVYFIKNLPVQVEAMDVITILIVALIISLLATIYPAYKAANLTPVDAIRNE
ncbi:MAG: ABC transporter permease, partial [candidate division WOR-3 bacterium]|nr:ABC transporter permease [candidate division WOR-3 bacterium]